MKVERNDLAREKEAMAYVSSELQSQVDDAIQMSLIFARSVVEPALGSRIEVDILDCSLRSVELLERLTQENPVDEVSNKEVISELSAKETAANDDGNNELNLRLSEALQQVMGLQVEIAGHVEELERVRSELSAREAEWKERERVLVLQTEDLRRLDLERDDAWTLGAQARELEWESFVSKREQADLQAEIDRRMEELERVRSVLSARDDEWKERERALPLQKEESFQFGTIFDYSHAPESANGNEELS